MWQILLIDVFVQLQFCYIVHCTFTGYENMLILFVISNALMNDTFSFGNEHILMQMCLIECQAGPIGAVLTGLACFQLVYCH